MPYTHFIPNITLNQTMSYQHKKKLYKHKVEPLVTIIGAVHQEVLTYQGNS
jgi:hypothetical protein